MASHSLMVGSNVGNVGRSTVLKDASRCTTGKHVASPNTRGVTVSSSPINDKPDVPPVLHSEFAMVNTSKTPPTSQAYGRNLRLPVSPKLILKSVVMGLSLLLGKGMAEPCGESPKTFFGVDFCGVNNSFTGSCNVDGLFFIFYSLMSPPQPNGNCTKDDGTIFPLFQPNSINGTCTDWQLLNEVKSQSIVNGHNCDANRLMNYCVPWLEFALNQSLNQSQCLGNITNFNSMTNSTSNVESEESMTLSLDDFTQFSLVSLISFQLLLLVSDICFSRSKNVEKNERVSTVANLKERIGDGGPDFQKMNANEIAREYLQAINERLTRKYFVKDYASSLVKAGLGIPLAIIRSRSGECIYENQPSSMISNYFLMAAVVDFFYK